jgi:hypothetical protein
MCVNLLDAIVQLVFQIQMLVEFRFWQEVETTPIP